MNIVAWVLGVVLSGVFGFAGITKAIDLDRARDHFGYDARQYRMIGAAEVAAAAAVIVGLIWRSVEFIAIAAGVGLCALMVGALLAHARVGDDAKATIPAGVMFVLAAVFTIVLALR